MSEESKQCKKCSTDFSVTESDRKFYEQIDVPEPTLCPNCRQQRRYAWRNERTLYRRKCDMCEKSMVSIYSADSPYPVYCPKCWWSDEWDAQKYGQEIDLERPFFDQFKELQLKVPRMALLNKNSVNSEYVNHGADNKDCYMSFNLFECENVMHSTKILGGKDSSDCYRLEGEGNEKLYWVIQSFSCFDCQFGHLLRDCAECYYCFDCHGCTNCFMSSNLRNQSYVWRNEQLSREEYKRRMSELELKRHSVREELLNEWKEMIFNEAIHKGTVVEQSYNCVGDFIFNSKEVHNGFEINETEDARNIFVVTQSKDFMDIYNAGINTELGYESHAIVNGYRFLFTHLSYDDAYVTYCDTCHGSENLFGCVGLKHKSYHILNKPYSKEDYEEKVKEVKNHMRKTGEWGEFFPPELSPFGYNETQGQVYMPLERDRARELGYTWQDKLPGTYGKETLATSEIPDNLDDIDESITDQILACESSGRNYNITKPELNLYKQLGVPIPRMHPDERYKAQLSIRPDRKLYTTTCKETGNELYTAYPPERRPEHMYSEDVYKSKIL